MRSYNGILQRVSGSASATAARAITFWISRPARMSGSAGSDSTEARSSARACAIAQFNSRSNVEHQSQPTNRTCSWRHYYNFHALFRREAQIHRHRARRSRGMRPPIIAGNPADGSITFDWGVNGALLFGRQRSEKPSDEDEASISTSIGLSWYTGSTPSVYHHPRLARRSKNVTVPNLGGFAALSCATPMRRSASAIAPICSSAPSTAASMRRRRKTAPSTVPYACISIGIGD